MGVGLIGLLIDEERNELCSRLERFKDQIRKLEDELVIRSKQMESSRMSHRQAVAEWTLKLKEQQNHSNQVEVLLQKAEKSVNDLQTKLHSKEAECVKNEKELVKVLDMLAEQSNHYPQSYNFEICVLMCSLMLTVRPFRETKKLKDSSVTERVLSRYGASYDGCMTRARYSCMLRNPEHFVHVFSTLQRAQLASIRSTFVMDHYDVLVGEQMMNQVFDAYVLDESFF